MDPEGEVATMQPMAAAESPVRPAACADAVPASLRCAGDAIVLWWQGRRTAVTRDHNGLQLEQLPDTGCLSWCTGPASVQYGKANGLLPTNHHPGQAQAAHAAGRGTKQCSDYSCSQAPCTRCVPSQAQQQLTPTVFADRITLQCPTRRSCAAATCPYGATALGCHPASAR